MTLETLSSNTAFGGVQGIYRHRSTATGTDMTFAVYVPPHAKGAKLAVAWYDHSYYSSRPSWPSISPGTPRD